MFLKICELNSLWILLYKPVVKWTQQDKFLWKSVGHISIFTYVLYTNYWKTFRKSACNFRRPAKIFQYSKYVSHDVRTIHCFWATSSIFRRERAILLKKRHLKLINIDLKCKAHLVHPLFKTSESTTSLSGLKEKFVFCIISKSDSSRGPSSGRSGFLYALQIAQIALTMFPMLGNVLFGMMFLIKRYSFIL